MSLLGPLAAAVIAVAGGAGMIACIVKGIDAESKEAEGRGG